MKINVLGTEYAILVKKYDEDEIFDRESCDGYCDNYSKEIVLCDMKTQKGWEHETEKTCEVAQKQNLRHEIVHAFLNESGLRQNALALSGSWAINEEMVDWFAIQGQKIYSAWQEADAL